MTFEEVVAAAQEAGADAQLQVLEDGAVTTAELRRSLDDYFLCLDESGLSYVDNGPNPVDGWRPLTEIRWRGLSDTEGPERDAACSRAHLDYVVLGYELVNDDVMDPPLMSGVQSCLRELNVDVQGDERNLADLLPLGHEDGARASVVEGCILKESTSYPAGVVIAY